MRYSICLPMAMLLACSQEVITLTEPPSPNETTCVGVSAGAADFTKFVAVGNSFVAGFQAGALFTEGQNNALPLILNKQFECAGGSTSFNQPSINSANGFNIFVTPNPANGVVLGRMLLQGLASPRPTPQVSGTEAIPNPSVNPSFIYTGSKAELNNFGVQAIMLGQALIPETGAWAGAGVDPRFNPFYGRLAFPGGTSTIIGDAVAAQGTFFLFWLGLDDFLLNAVYGGDETKAPITQAAAFDMQYKLAVGALLASNPDLKGVVLNYPNIFKMPHFTSVPWNAVPLDETTAGGLTASLANNYNAFLDGMVAATILTADEAAKRKLTYTAGQNAVLIADESLTDLSPYMQGPYAGLLPYAQARQTANTDILPLTAGSVIGTALGGDATKVYGVSVPLPDQYTLTPQEIVAIETARTAFNNTVRGVAEMNGSRIAFVDIDAALEALIAARLMVIDNVSITPNINPPTGIYSEDGIHPNSRGYAFLTLPIIEAINETFGATLNPTNISQYKATGVPVP